MIFIHSLPYIYDVPIFLQVHLKSPSPETSVMFTRLDSERNAKIMKKAVMDDKLNAEKYKVGLTN